MSSDPLHARPVTPEPMRSAHMAVREFAPPEQAEGEPTLVDSVWTLIENWRLVGAMTGAALFLGVAYAFLAPPTFRSDILLQAEDNQKTVPGLDDLQTMFSDKNLADTEIEIIRSRMLVGAVVDQVNLTIVARPRRFPVFGGAVARHYDGDGVASPILGLARFAWGGERIIVTRLEVPEQLLDEKLLLTARDAGRWDLFGPDDELLASGEVGKAVSTPQKKGTVAVFVQALEARP